MIAAFFLFGLFIGFDVLGMHFAGASALRHDALLRNGGDYTQLPLDKNESHVLGDGVRGHASARTTHASDFAPSSKYRVRRHKDDEEYVIVDAEESVEETKVVSEDGDPDEKTFREKMHGWLKFGTGCYVFVCVVLCVISIARYASIGCPCMNIDVF